jgi:hypothetical protein
VLDHEAQRRVAVEQAQRHAVEEGGLTVEDVHLGVGGLAVHEQRQARLLHRLQRGREAIEVRDTGVGVGGGAGRVELHAVHDAPGAGDLGRRRLVREVQRHQRLKVHPRRHGGQDARAVGQRLVHRGDGRLEVRHDHGAPEHPRGGVDRERERRAVAQVQVPVIGLQYLEFLHRGAAVRAEAAMLAEKPWQRYRSRGRPAAALAVRFIFAAGGDGIAAVARLEWPARFSCSPVQWRFDMSSVKKVVLAYSGGLDTSVILKWLQDVYKCEVVTFTADIGQGEELEPARAKAKAAGIKSIYIDDLREEFVRDFVFPMFRANTVYEGEYLLGTSIARPLIAKRLIEIARMEKADAISHGATGKGNDQVRFELGAYALMPNVKVIAPWREWDLTSRETLLAYADTHGIPVDFKKRKGESPFSMDANLLHISYEGGILEDPAAAPPEKGMWRLTCRPRRRRASPSTSSSNSCAAIWSPSMASA